MKRWLLTLTVAVSLGAMAQAPESGATVPTEEDCLGLIAVLPTFQIKKMTVYYENNPGASGKELAQQLHSLADGGDKDAQFTYSMLVLNGYCIPRDVCAARRYLEMSRGGLNNWEKTYPIPPWPKEADTACN